MLDGARLAARLVGLCVAAAFAVAATQLLTIGFEASPLIGGDTAADIDSWIRRPPLAGAGILGGIALVLVGLVSLVGALWPRRGPSSITTRRRGGWTRIDRESLGAAVQRRLDELDRRNDVSTKVRRSGRIDVDLTSVDVQVDGPAAKIRNTLDEVCEVRNLPCRSGTITVRGRRSTKNRRHTIQ